MARELDALIKDTSGTLDSPALNQRMDDVNALVNRAQASTRGLLNHAGLVGVGLILLTFACALMYPRLTVAGKGKEPAHERSK